MDYTSISFPLVCVSRYFHLFLLRFPKKNLFSAFSVISSAILLFLSREMTGCCLTGRKISLRKKRKEEEEEEEMSQISLSHKLIFLKPNFHPRPLMDFLRPTPP